MAKKNTIRCPHCGAEYLPAEIFYPEDFLGHPMNIIKDTDGDILGYNGNDMNTSESYVCDKCGNEFEVEAIVTFKTSVKDDLFAEDDFFKEEK